MNTYRIIAKTNAWIAARDYQFNGRTEVVLEEGMPLKAAQRRLLEMFNQCYDTSYTNWGIAVSATKGRFEGAIPSFTDGTRSFEYDSRTYRIEEEEM